MGARVDHTSEQEDRELAEALHLSALEAMRQEKKRSGEREVVEIDDDEDDKAAYKPGPSTKVGQSVHTQIAPTHSNGARR